MSDLDRLIEAVEADSIARHDLDAFIPWRGLDALTNDSLDAYNGSLDAAKRLHDALLPGWGYQLCRSETSPDIYGFNLPGQDSAISSDPARAWLLAILRAVKAQAQL